MVRARNPAGNIRGINYVSSPVSDTNVRNFKRGPGTFAMSEPAITLNGELVLGLCDEKQEKARDLVTAALT